MTFQGNLLESNDKDENACCGSVEGELGSLLLECAT